VARIVPAAGTYWELDPALLDSQIPAGNRALSSVKFSEAEDYQKRLYSRIYG